VTAPNLTRLGTALDLPSSTPRRKLNEKTTPLENLTEERNHSAKSSPFMRRNPVNNSTLENDNEISTPLAPKCIPGTPLGTVTLRLEVETAVVEG
jgi:hypothetical protein